MKNQHRIHKIVGLTNCGINVREAKSKGFRILGMNKQNNLHRNDHRGVYEIKDFNTVSVVVTNVKGWRRGH